MQRALRARREAIYSAGTIPFEDGTLRQVATAGVLPDRGEALRQLVRTENARTCVETGFAFAMSGSYILDALLDHPSNINLTSSILTSMDPYQLAGFGGAGLRHFREVGATPLHEFHQLKSEVVLPKLIAEKRTFDVAFIDGDHRFEGVFVDVFFARKLVGPASSSSLTTCGCPRSRSVSRSWSVASSARSRHARTSRAARSSHSCA